MMPNAQEDQGYETVIPLNDKDDLKDFSPLDEKEEKEHVKLLENFDFAAENYIETMIPARLDRLPWSPWHWYIVTALGITWILDGLEVNLVGVLATQLTRSDTLNFTEFQIGLSGTVYLAGAISGSLLFGYLTDRFGRRRLNLTTPFVYLLATALTAFSVNFPMFCVFRFITGAGIGGEYSSINSTIDELIPARLRGRVDLAINGSYWLGAALGGLASLLFLDTTIFAADSGWRYAFFIGASLGFSVIILRIWVPESPRWSLIHGYDKNAEETISQIEEKILRKLPPGQSLPEPQGPPVIIYQKKHILIRSVIKAMFKIYPKRSILGLVLMASQAFCYNAVGFTYSLILTKFYNVTESEVGIYTVPFVIGNFLGPIVLGRYFDTIGRKKMIFVTYMLSSILLSLTALLFYMQVLNALTQTICWGIVFFVSSPAASAAYLTVSEIFPVEVRTMAIAVFYSFGTAIGGLIGPALFGALLQTGSLGNISLGYLLGALVMAIAAIVEIYLGVDAEGQSLEAIAIPLSSIPENKEEVN